MRKKIWILLSFLILQVAAFQSSAAIGDWKAYMAYSEVQEIEEAGNWIFVQASSNLYAYNRNDQSIQTFSKMDFLNDCDIQHIAYNKTAKRLLILYSNANIDLMNTQNWSVQNLPDYYAATITGERPSTVSICMANSPISAMDWASSSSIWRRGKSAILILWDSR